MMLPYMKFYPADFLGDTMHLNTAEVGAYMLLIMHYWRNGGLPNKNSELAGITKLPLRSWVRMKPTLQAFFHDGWRHKRIDAELRQLLKIVDQKVGAAYASQLARKSRHIGAPKSTTFVVNTQNSQSRWLAERSAKLAQKDAILQQRMHTYSDKNITSSFTEAAREVPPAIPPPQFRDPGEEPLTTTLPHSTLRDPGEVPRVSPANGDGGDSGLPHTPLDQRLDASREWMKKYNEAKYGGAKSNSITPELKAILARG